MIRGRRLVSFSHRGRDFLVPETPRQLHERITRQLSDDLRALQRIPHAYSVGPDIHLPGLRFGSAKRRR